MKINTKKTFIMIALAVILGINTSYSKDLTTNKGETLTLEECIEISLSKNPSIELGNKITKVYESKLGQIKASYFPQVNVSSGYNRQNGITSSSYDKSKNNYSSAVSLNQLVFDFGKTPLKLKIQDINVLASKYDTNDTEIKVAYNVKQAYYQALTEKININIYKQSIKQFEQHLKQAKAFFQAGRKPKIDVTNAEVNLSNAKLKLIKAESSYKVAIANLNNAMGVPDALEYNLADTLTLNEKLEKNVEISNQNKSGNSNAKNTVLKTAISKKEIIDTLVFKKSEITFQDAIKKAYDNRPDLKALVTKEMSANQSVKLAQKDYYPTVTGVANYSFGGQEFPLDNGWTFGANATIPVFDGFSVKNKVKEAKANVNVASTNIEVLKQNIYLQVKQAYIALMDSESSIPVAKLTVKQAMENFELANGRYNAGVGNSTEVQDAETNYYNAQLGYVQAIYNNNMAKINLDKAMGVR